MNEKYLQLQKNDVITITVNGLGINGEGIARFNGLAVFIAGALPNEVVEAKIIFIKKTFAVAKLIKIVRNSAVRARAECPVFEQCGGCALQHLKYDEQLKFKQSTVSETLKKVGGIDFKVNDTVASDLIYGYRNKMSLPIRQTKDGVKIGFFKKNSHDIVDIVDCPLQKSDLKTVIAIVKDFLAKSGYSAFDEASGKGLIRHLSVRYLGEIMTVTLVINSNKGIDVKPLSEAFVKAYGDKFALYLNYNTLNNNVIFGDRFSFVCGNNSQINVDGLKLNIHPAAFFQVNDGVRKKLYNCAINAAVNDCDCGTCNAILDGENVADTKSIKADSAVLDAYSGAGVMTAMLAKHFVKAVGIEINAQAHEAAKQLALSNGIENMTSYLGDVAEVLPKLTDKIETVVLDPPKSGCDKSVLDAIAKTAKKIVYISCNPATLSRDCKTLLERGFTIKSITPFDMFPQTCSIETLAVLVKGM